MSYIVANTKYVGKYTFLKTYYAMLLHAKRFPEVANISLYSVILGIDITQTVHLQSKVLTLLPSSFL